MSAQQSSADRHQLDPRIAVELLDKYLGMRECRPSGGLRALFEEAGRVARDLAKPKRQVSTRLLLFAVHSMNRTALDPFELSAITTLVSFLDRNRGRLQGHFAEYFQNTDGKRSPHREMMTANVGKLLDMAMATALRRAPDERQVTVADVLRCFPPDRSGADALFLSLEIAPTEFHSALEEGINTLLQEAADQPDELPDSSDPGPPGSNSTRTPGAPGVQPPPRSKTRKRTALDERVSTHTDQPATADQLGRRSFAQVLALRIKQAKTADEERMAREKASRGGPRRRKPTASKDAAFIVHLHGPWGSGKSSVLNFLRDELEGESDPPWIVIDFNAWRDQRLQPPWWTLITTIYLGARAKLGWRKVLLFLRWQLWRARADYFPIIGVMLFATTVLALLWAAYGRLAPPPGGSSPGSGFENLLKVVTLAMTFLTIMGATYVGFRTLALGSRRAAQAYSDLKADPYKPIASLFEHLVRAIGRPVAVFIDDLDRCDATYVVDLLEGIQTLMRGAAITYVIAADRKWICSSFEQRYSGFTGPIGEPGRPLGYLFLDKMFQVSAPLPLPSPEARSSYWVALLKASPDRLREHRTRVLDAERDADERASKLTGPEEMQAFVAKAKTSSDPLKLPAARAAVAKRITSQEALDKLDHRLEAFSDLVEPNPRAMKRLVNAYAMHQSTLFLSGSNTIFNTLVRWTILELRWPVLADFLATRPDWVDKLRSPLPEIDRLQAPEALWCLFGDPMVIRVMGPRNGSDGLTAAALKKILGAVQSGR